MEVWRWVEFGLILRAKRSLSAASTLEVLSSLGFDGWNGSTREHGQMRAKQLFDSRVLEELASKL